MYLKHELRSTCADEVQTKMARSKKIDNKETILFTRTKDEMNLAEFPFCQLSDKESKTKVLTFGYDLAQEDGSVIRREWRIEGGAECGLPRPIDEDVYVGLMLLTTRQGFNNPKIIFTVYELLEVLGWDKSGKSYSRIRASLRRLRNLSIEAVNAFKDNQTKRYEKYLGFGIIDDYEISAGISSDALLQFDDSEVALGKSYIRWNTRLFKSFQDGYIKNLDQEFYRSLKSTVSKRLYRFLDKKFYFSNEISIDIIQLGYEHIGLSRQSPYPSKVWEKLMSGMTELKQRNYLAKFERKERIAYFLRANGSIIYSLLEEKGESLSATAIQQLSLSNQIVQDLTAIGVKSRQAQQIVSGRNIEQLQRILDLILYFRTVILQRSKERIKNPPGYLLTILRDGDFEIPTKFITEQRLNHANIYSGTSEELVAQLQEDIAYYQQLDRIGEEEFAKVSPIEQEIKINLYLKEMESSAHKATYQLWSRDLLREHATYQVKKELAKASVVYKCTDDSSN